MIDLAGFHAALRQIPALTGDECRSAGAELDRLLSDAAKHRAREAAILSDILDERDRAMAAAGLDECAAFLSPPRVP